MKFELAPHRNRDQMIAIVALPVIAAAGFLLVAIENRATAAWAPPIGVVACIGAAFVVRWGLRRARPVTIELDGPPPDMRGERGYVQTFGKYNTHRFKAIAFHLDGKRYVVREGEPTPGLTGRALFGPLHVLPPDDFRRLAQLLRLQ